MRAPVSRSILVVVRRWLAAADVGLAPGPALRLWAGSVAAGAFAGSAFGPRPALALGLAGLAGPPVLLFSRRGRRDTRLVAELPDALDRLAADLRGGGAVLSALEALSAGPGPLAADLRRVTGRSAAGAALVGSIATWAEERPLPAVAAVAGALEVAVTVGGRSAAALEGLAGALRDQRDIQDEVVALSAQARLSALVVALAPLGSLGLSLAVDPRVTTTLTGTNPGRACLAFGLGLELAAWVWMHRLVRVSGAGI